MLPAIIRARFQAYHTACVQNERNLATALEMYSLESGQLYPENLITLTSNGIARGGPFITSIPECPSDRVSHINGYTTSNNFTEYLIECPGTHEIQLVGRVEDLYPQIANGILNQYNADE